MAKFSGGDSIGYIRIVAELKRQLANLEKGGKEQLENKTTKDEAVDQRYSRVTTHGGVHHQGKNEKGANAFYGSTFGKGTQIGSINNYVAKRDSNDDA